MSTIHLGHIIADEKLAKLTRKNYVTNDNHSSLEDGVLYSAEEMENMKFQALLGFDSYMAKVYRLDSREFEDVVNNVLFRSYFRAEENIQHLKHEPGCYMLVLDQYKQVYVGSSHDIRSKIISHWNRRVPIDRLPNIVNGDITLSIDSFGALDTTRIYVDHCIDFIFKDKQYLEKLESKWVLGRTYSEAFPRNMTYI